MNIKIFTLIVILVNGLYAGINSTYNEKNAFKALDSLSNKELAVSLVSSTKDNLPIKLDKSTTIIRIESVDSTIKYVIEISKQNLLKELGETLIFNKDLSNKFGLYYFNKNKRKLCNSAFNIYALNRGIKYNYLYLYNDGIQLVDFTIAKEDCNESNI